MVKDRLEPSGIVEVTSMHAGALVGTAAVIGKKVAALGVKVVAPVGGLIDRGVQKQAPVKHVKHQEEQIRPRPSEADVVKKRPKAAKTRKEAATKTTTVLKSDLAAVRAELAETQGNVEETQSQLSSQLETLEAERESLISDLDRARREARETETREAAETARMNVLESDLAAARRELDEIHSAERDARSPLSSDVNAVPAEEKVARAPSKKLPSVTQEEVRAAVSLNAEERILLTRVLSGLASSDAQVRADAVGTGAGVRHGLLVQALAAQAAGDRSPQVRRECIKTLTMLQMEKGLPAIQRALADRVASVRLAAVWGVYRLAGAENAPAIIEMLSDEDEEVRRRAATCIGWMGREELAARLLPLLTDTSAAVRRATVEAMGKLRSRDVVSALIESLNDPDKSIRKAVFDTLETITGKQMSKSFPTARKSLQRVIARWREWWGRNPGEATPQ